MKKIFALHKWILALLALSLLLFAACSSDTDDDDDDDNNNGGELSVWKLCDCNSYYEEKSESELSPVYWGEYIYFKDNTMYWNNRFGDPDSEYSYTFDSSEQKYTLTSENDKYGSYEATVLQQTDSVLVLSFDDGNYRWYKKGSVRIGDSSESASSTSSSSDNYCYIAVYYSGSGSCIYKKVTVGGETVGSNGTGKSSYKKINVSGKLSYTTYKNYTKNGGAGASQTYYNVRTGGGSYNFQNGCRYSINCANGNVSKD